MGKQRRYHAHETAGEDAREGSLLAAFWQRALGFLIDFFLVVILYSPLEIAWRYYVRHQQNIHIDFGPHEPGPYIALVVYFALALYFGRGRTLGKWIARTRVLSLTHSRLGIWQSMERALGYGASFLEGGFGFVQFFINRNRQCVHDRIAETIVVDIRVKSRLAATETQGEQS